MAFSCSLPSRFTAQPFASRHPQACTPTRLEQSIQSRNRAAPARSEEQLFKRPDVPVDWNTSYDKQQKGPSSHTEQFSGKMETRPRSALEQASFATNQTLTRRMEDKPRVWGLGMLGLGDHIQRLSKINFGLSKATQNGQADLSKLMPASKA
ncbi:hypothetical protein WJX74_005498 [Apatococcus lobatus]|uniref:Uncharacterized protein n=1 Tax=Apatococcus lobatus TaxID=904363 RepID=A0AAW1QW49_9CHLO